VAASAGPPPLELPELPPLELPASVPPLLEPELPPLEPPLDEPLLEPELPPLELPLDEPLLPPELLPGSTPFGAEAQQTTPCPGQAYGSVPSHTRPLPGATHVPPETLHTLPSELMLHATTASRPQTVRNAIARRMAGDPSVRPDPPSMEVHEGAEGAPRGPPA
jgi:hypothetical protein